jgi:CHAT domain-containing protein
MRDIPPQLLNIGNIYLGQENCEQALEYYQRALAGFETNRAQVGTSYALSNIGNAYGCLGQYSEALSYIERSRLLKTKFLPKDPGTLSDIGRIYRLQGKYREALDYYQKSLDLFQELKDFSFFAAGVMEAMAEIYYLQGNYSKSLEFADKATALAKQLDYPYAWNSLTTAGYAHRALSQTKEARKDLESAIGKIESLSTQTLGGQSQQEHYLEGMTGPYQMLVDISVSEDKILEAFGYAERFKARTLLDILQTGKIDITKAMSAQEREQERKFKLGIVSLNTRISREKEKISLDELNQQLQKKRLEFEDFQTRINISHPELKVQRGEMKPIGLDEAGGLLSDAKSAFLEFVVANNKAFTFVITKNALDKTTLKVYPIEVNQKDLTARVEKYRATLAAGDLDFQKQSRELYDLLLKPARAELSGKTNLIIVPDGPLWNLPFQALQNEKNRYLVEQAAVSYAPSLTALKEMAKKAKARKPDAGMELVAFGNPIVGKATSDRIKQVFMSEKLEPLPESERLVNEMGKMYGASRSKVYTGDAAREETAKTEAPKYRIVQFATHGILNNVSPMYSHLVLAQNDKNPNEDGLLEAWEMKDLDLKADMVILSACDTARGRISSGEGMIGMSWALFIAGTPTTIASQWKVESSSTTELMLEFHRQLLTGKVTKAEALRRASLKLLHSPKYQHPSYWGAWVLVGDGN